MRRLIACLAFALLSSSCRNNDIEVYRAPKEAPAPAAAAGGHPHREVDWKVPSGWVEQAPSQMRVGSFTAAGGSVDISVIPLSGDVGGTLANVNRWRGQLSLDPVDEAGLKDIARPATAGSHKLLLVEFGADNPPRRLLAAIIPRGEQTWFFKATGPDAAVREIKPAFMAFLATLSFHNHE